jgi:hypothetical protein
MTPPAKTWRTGHRQRRNIYFGDALIAVAVGDDREAAILACEIVTTMNRAWAPVPEGQDDLDPAPPEYEQLELPLMPHVPTPAPGSVGRLMAEAEAPTNRDVANLMRQFDGFQ